ncbi:MAG: type I-U CRISPR-associated protein Cas7, partial [Candidatus Eisenbacteria bacterium]
MPISNEDLRSAIAGNAAALRCRARLQPAGGPGTKVFPPTYSGAVYAMEMRRLPGRETPIPCVLLDSVQSQANRMEEALQYALDRGDLAPAGLPIVEVDFTPYFPGDGVDEALRLRDAVGRITSLEAPHRIADAILRDSMKDGIPFRDTEEGRRLSRAS